MMAHSEGRKPTFIDLCCGCGGLSLGFIRAGWRCLGGVDMNEPSCRTYEANIGVPAHVMPVAEYDANLSVDAIVSGWPCQPHSLSGQRLGMRDPRAMAFHGVMEQIGRLQPRVVVFENVQGLMSSKDADGKPGGALKHVRQRMMDAGYTVVHNVLDAHAYGVPQTRLRLFMVGMLDGQMWVPPREWPVEDRRTVYDAFCDILGRDDVDLPNHDASSHRAETIERIKAMWRENRWSLYEGFTQSWARLALDLPAPTQTENHGGLCIHPEEPRVITAREMARLQSFPDEWTFHGSKRDVLMQIGNAVPVGLARAVAESIKPMLSGG